MITSLIRIFTARSIKPFIFSSAHNNEIDFNVENPGLYFHIPFCRKLCSFCPYYKVEYDKALLKDFYKALLKEIKIAAELVYSGKDGKGKYYDEKYDREKGKRNKRTIIKNSDKKDIGSIYFGGGSPALAIEYLSEIIRFVRKYFNTGGNMGIELHPSDVGEALLEKLKDCGFNMVSIGVQSFNNKCLSALGRSDNGSLAGLRLVRKFNFDVVDVDLIFGIPGQNEKELVEDFKIAAENGATQISTYPFIEFSYTGLKNKILTRRQKRKMLEALIDTAKNAGFKRSSIWTFSKGGKLQYSSVTRDSFIGFGPSAATLLKDIFKINTFSVKEYIKFLNNNNGTYNIMLPTALSIKFNPRIRALYWLFWSAYRLYIDNKKFYKLFGKKSDNMFKFEFYLARKSGFIEEYKDGFKLTERGAYIFHLVEQAYTGQYIDKVWRASIEDPWPERIVLY